MHDMCVDLTRSPALYSGGYPSCRPNPPLHVYFDAGLLPSRYHYTDYSRVITSTALASLPPQNWVVKQRQRQQQQQQQFDQRQR